MFATSAVATAGTGLLDPARRPWLETTSGRRSEHGQPLGKLRGAAMRAFCSLPTTGAHHNLAILLALFAMKFVNRHGTYGSQ